LDESTALFLDRYLPKSPNDNAVPEDGVSVITVEIAASGGGHLVAAAKAKAEHPGCAEGEQRHAGRLVVSRRQRVRIRANFRSTVGTARPIFSAISELVNPSNFQIANRRNFPLFKRSKSRAYSSTISAA